LHRDQDACQAEGIDDRGSGDSSGAQNTRRPRLAVDPAAAAANPINDSMAVACQDTQQQPRDLDRSTVKDPRAELLVGASSNPPRAPQHAQHTTAAAVASPSLPLLHGQQPAPANAAATALASSASDADVSLSYEIDTSDASDEGEDGVQGPEVAAAAFDVEADLHQLESDGDAAAADDDDEQEEEGEEEEAEEEDAAEDSGSGGGASAAEGLAAAGGRIPGGRLGQMWKTVSCVLLLLILEGWAFDGDGCCFLLHT